MSVEATLADSVLTTSGKWNCCTSCLYIGVQGGGRAGLAAAEELQLDVELESGSVALLDLKTRRGHEDLKTHSKNQPKMSQLTLKL
ncbi:hypothetical protein M8J76_009817 [Diaphorina citri]|nr:hypothetical protein M8J76_009817 [Diaphorina citri]